MKREIFRAGGRYEMCHILYHGDRYLIAQTERGDHLVCSPGYGTWCEISPMDLVSRLERLDTIDARNIKAAL